jgi:two-component SAPR family response regulator
MPHQSYQPQPSDPELLQELLGEVHAFLPLLERDEIGTLLEALKDDFLCENKCSWRELRKTRITARCCVSTRS